MIKVKQEYLWISKCTLSTSVEGGTLSFFYSDYESLIITSIEALWSSDLEEVNLILGCLNPKHSQIFLSCYAVRLGDILHLPMFYYQICSLQLLSH